MTRDMPEDTNSPRVRALAEHPAFPFLNPADPAAAEKLFGRVGFLNDGEALVSLAKAGEGNMNLVLRATTDAGRSLVVKQARPWVEKYPAIAAPWDRAVSERRFYERARNVPGVGDRMPELLGHDDATRTLALEDLGEASDLSTVYAGDAITGEELDAAADYLKALHAHTAGERGGDFLNRAMRALNHAHLYDIPLQDHGFLDLDELEPGLADAAAEARADEAFAAKMRAVGDRYLADPAEGSCLLHGDFFPGSLLRTPGGLRVIDPEFSFAGPPEFDVAVFAAHLALANRPAGEADRFLNRYGAGRLDAEAVAQFAACEVVRRLIGVAQLPLGQTAGRRAKLLDAARTALMTDDLAPLLAAGA